MPFLCSGNGKVLKILSDLRVGNRTNFKLSTS